MGGITVLSGPMVDLVFDIYQGYRVTIKEAEHRLLQKEIELLVNVLGIFSYLQDTIEGDLSGIVADQHIQFDNGYAISWSKKDRKRTADGETISKNAIYITYTIQPLNDRAITTTVVVARFEVTSMQNGNLMLCCEEDEDGCVVILTFCNAQLHSFKEQPAVQVRPLHIDPATFEAESVEIWFHHGVCYRIDHPLLPASKVFGECSYHDEHGLYHREPEDGPAVYSFSDNIAEQYYVHGIKVAPPTVGAHQSLN
jgi:hypothetical protein